eukprot:772636-Rhodomonas_salina.2
MAVGRLCACYAMPAYARATRCPVLTSRMLLPAQDQIRSKYYRWRSHLGRLLRYRPTHARCPVLRAIDLRARYAMSGTDLG